MSHDAPLQQLHPLPAPHTRAVSHGSGSSNGSGVGSMSHTAASSSSLAMHARTQSMLRQYRPSASSAFTTAAGAASVAAASSPVPPAAAHAHSRMPAPQLHHGKALSSGSGWPGMQQHQQHTTAFDPIRPPSVSSPTDDTAAAALQQRFDFPARSSSGHAHAHQPPPQLNRPQALRPSNGPAHARTGSVPVLSSSLLSSSSSFFSTLAAMPQATAAAASANAAAPPTSSAAAALRAMLARPASIDVTGNSSFTPMMLHHLQQSNSGGSGSHSRARAGGSGGAPVRAVDLRSNSTEHSPPSIPEHAERHSMVPRHPSRSAAATPPVAGSPSIRTPSLRSSPAESPTRIPRRSAHSVERARRPSPAPAASFLSSSAAALSLQETEAALAASSRVLAVMSLSAAAAAPAAVHTESHPAAATTSSSLRSSSPVKHASALPPRSSTAASTSHASAHGSTAPAASAPPTAPVTTANSPALAFALEQAKAAKARLLEHKARARADAARVAALGQIARYEKELSSNRERDALMRRRSEIYALNHIKRLYHEEMFAQFMSEQQRKQQAALDGSNHTPRAGAAFDSEVASI